MDNPEPLTPKPLSSQDAPTLPYVGRGPRPTLTTEPLADPDAKLDGTDVGRFALALVEINLMSSSEIDAFLGSFPPTRRPANAEQLARALVGAGKLTGYQAAAIYQGKTKGLIIGKYVVLDKLGAGGMGMVFKATHRGLNRVVALKLLPPSSTRDPDLVLRFKREAELAARLSHPNVVAALDADEYHGVHFLVMECVEGVDLQKTVARRGPLPIESAVDFILQAAKGLREAHNRGIIHRDIKPANLLLDTGGTVKVLDLGLAKILETSNTLSGPSAGNELTRSGVFMGTVDFMAPEQAEDSRRADHRADIYSLGCTLYFLLAGRVPFPAETVLKRLMAHLEREIPSLRTLRADVSPILDDLCRRMLAKSPEDRPQSMGEVVELLEQCAADILRPSPVVKVVTDLPETPVVAAITAAALDGSSALPTEHGDPNVSPMARPALESPPARSPVAGGDPSPNFKLNLADLLIDVRSEIGAVESDPGPRAALLGGVEGNWTGWRSLLAVSVVGLLASAVIGIAIFASASRKKGDQGTETAISTTANDASPAESQRLLIRDDPSSPETVADATSTKATIDAQPEKNAIPGPAPDSLAASPPEGSGTAFDVNRPAPLLDAQQKKGVTAPPNPISFPAAPWVLRSGPNGLDFGNISDEMGQKLRELAEQRAVLKSIAFTPGGGWVILHGHNDLFARDVGDEVYRALGEFQTRGAELTFIAFTPIDGWVILTSRHGFAARNIPAEARQRLNELVQNRQTPKSIAFSQNGGWVILNDKNGFSSRNVPKRLVEKLHELAGKGYELKPVAFFPDGSWLLPYSWNGREHTEIPQDVWKAVAKSDDRRTELKSLSVMPHLIPRLSRDDPEARDYVLQRMAAYQVPGLSIALVNGGKLEWARAYGVPRLGSNAPLTTQIRFQAAGLSKPVSALAALRLVHHGQLALDDDANKILSSWKIPDSPLTRNQKPRLRGLLDHSAGLSVQRFDGYTPGSPLPTLIQILDGAAPANSRPVRVEEVPGDRYRYSSGGYAVLQQMIIDVTKTTFPEAMRSLVLDPLDMRDSAFEQPLPDGLESQSAWAHRDAVALAGHGHVYPELAAEGLWTTPSDLATFIIALQRAKRIKESIVRASLIDDMLRRHKGDAGLGVLLRGKGKSLWFYQNGINVGFESFLIGSVDSGQGAVLMTNAAGGMALIEELLPLLEAEYNWSY
jgi:serine/threonine protein kinase/CubicO group peptidase (beta-lactamase class C family)